MDWQDMQPIEKSERKRPVSTAETRSTLVAVITRTSLERAAKPHRDDFLFLEHPQQFGLHCHVALGDFIQENRPALGLEKVSFLPRAWRR